MRGAIGFGLLLGGAGIAAACTTVLGDDFRIGADGAGGSGVQGGGGATTSSGVQAGGGGAGGGTVSSSSTAGGGGGAGAGSGSGGGGAGSDGGGGSGGSGGGPACGDVNFGDCDANPLDCETDLTTSTNCGACGAQCVGGTCDRRSCSGVTQLAIVPGVGNFISIYAGNIYWTTATGSGNGYVHRVPIAGGRVTDLATRQTGAYGIVANAGGLFWSCNGANVVVRANLGGGMQDPTSTSFTPLFVTGDEHEIFWSQREDAGLVGGPRSTIGRLDVALGTTNENFLSAPYSPHGIALDTQFLYWVDRADRGGTVNRIDRHTGGSPMAVLATGQENPYGIVVDDLNLYWTNNGGLGVAKMPKDGSVTPVSIAPGSNLRDIAMDATHIYWSDQGEGRVKKVPKAGGTVRQYAGIGTPNGIAIDATYVYWVTESEPSRLYRVLK